MAAESECERVQQRQQVQGAAEADGSQQLLLLLLVQPHAHIPAEHHTYAAVAERYEA